ncbi:DsbA family protein [Candidatus Protochlamydia phocaeensis]|uniref:DsbA family protein n=1 Tax=Candidatus Protochlamydia phocaeensis TaxID=1414722 RepID=UPI0008381FE1|nr:thioredoxin domain-containing protein [Candidatus Protochlamydia phocaeensis]
MKSIIVSSLSSLLAMFFMTSLAADSSPAQTSITIQGQPTIGYPKAPVQVVALLEPKCPDSKRYNNASFPKLEEEFINTNKIRYTVIPVSFLPNSMPAAIALWCVYNQEPEYPNADLFFKYLNYIYKNQPPERENWATIERLQKFAAATSPAIQLDRLKDCIEMEKYRVQIEKNTAYGNRLMNGHLSTPTIFVEGVKVENKDDTIDYDKLKKAILDALERKKTEKSTP